MGFLPIRLGDLQVGLYIKLDYGWGAHPFLRNTFTIRSQKDIAIIRKNGLTKITYDPTRSDPKALERLAAPPQSEKQGDPEEDVSVSEAEVEVEEAEKALAVEKEYLYEKQFSHQDAIEETAKAYQDALIQNKTAMQMISQGKAEGVEYANQVLESMMEVLNGPAPTLSLVKASTPKGITEEVSAHAMNVCSLSLLLGDTLGLNPEDRQALGQGAMFHNIGLHRVPPAVRKKKKDALSNNERHQLETYPHYGRQMVEGLAGMSRGSLDIISQHRENLDGTGYPQGLIGDQIAFLPRVVRVVTEYNSLLINGHGVATPTQALAYLYTKLKEQCQPDIIDAFITTVTVYPPGSFVRLSDDSVGLVVKTNKSERLCPLVVLYETTQDSGDLVIVNLATQRDLTIKESLNPKDLDPKILAQLQQSLGGGARTGYFVSA